MKKSCIIIDILASLALIGAYETRSFERRKLGFVRWLNYNGGKLREALPLEAIKYIVLAVAVVIATILVIKVFRNAESSILDKVMAVLTVALTAYYAYATVVIVYDVSKASFMIVPLIGLAEYLMLIRCAIGAHSPKDIRE